MNNLAFIPEFIPNINVIAFDTPNLEWDSDTLIVNGSSAETMLEKLPAAKLAFAEKVKKTIRDYNLTTIPHNLPTPQIILAALPNKTGENIIKVVAYLGNMILGKLELELTGRNIRRLLDIKYIQLADQRAIEAVYFSQIPQTVPGF